MAMCRYVKKYFINKNLDFLLLGGSVVPFLGVIILLKIFLDSAALDTIHVMTSFIAFYILQFFVNFPHFMQSYMLLYSDFTSKISLKKEKSRLYLHYSVIGLFIPLLMTIYYVYSIFEQNVYLIGYSINVMLFFVGWHYVKQGYGILISDGVLKKIFFSSKEKCILKVNGYIFWLMTWTAFNTENNIFYTYDNVQKFIEIEHYLFNFPEYIYLSLLYISVISFLMIMVIFYKAFQEHRDGLINGMTAYIVSVYLWRIPVLIDPIFVAIVPFLHSLQYMVIVRRYQINKTQKYNWFYLKSMIGGAAIFVGVPMIFYIATTFLQLNYTYLFIHYLVMTWVFINIHHYFIDHVIWRKENKDVARYLFS